MRKLTVFNHISLDGFFTGVGGDIGWIKMDAGDPEFKAFTEDNARGGGVLVFGRITYEMMAAYWPTPMAMKNDPVVAERMNSLPKIVFSRTLDAVSWHNATLLKGDPASEMRRLKLARGDDMVIFGSGCIVSQLAQANLVELYQFIINPIILGKGRTMFEGLTHPRPLKLTTTRTFRNGSVLLCYEPK